jgi:hypothetical protein
MHNSKCLYEQIRYVLSIDSCAESCHSAAALREWAWHGNSGRFGELFGWTARSVSTPHGGSL